MRTSIIAIVLLAILGCAAEGPASRGADRSPASVPANGAVNVNPDAHLMLTFPSPPTIGAAGSVRIFDAADHSLVDTLDLGIPVSPRPDGRGRWTPDPGDKTVYQIDVIGGVEFHFFPIIVHGNAATIYPHHGVLKYGREYVVRIDSGVLTTADGKLGGFRGDIEWRFTTKRSPPPADARRVVVAPDGSGDFDTVQGAIDFLPAKPARRVTIFIRNGDYEEIVFASGKSDVTIRGESRDGVRVHYRNNSAFNPPRGGPSRRPAFSIQEGRDIQLSQFTIENRFVGQAEALLIRGERIVVDRMTLSGSGDALTTYGTIYMVDSKLTGHGDTILGYAALYCLRCEVSSIGPMTWTRTPQGSHGNVFVDSTLIGLDVPLPWTVTPTDPGQKTPSVFARLPRNSPGASAVNFPFAEMVLIDTRTQGFSAEGWGPVEEEPAFDRSNVRFFEFNTMDMNGRPVDMSRRHEIVRQLRLPADAKIVADYRNPAFVLGGWTPVVQPSR